MKSFILVFFILISNFGYSQNCKCLRGYGAGKDDMPKYIITFNNQQSVSVCGFVNEDITIPNFYISEFNIYTCDSIRELVGYSATNYCHVYLSDDTLYVNRIKYFNTSDDNKWKKYPFSQTKIYTSENEIIVSDEKVILNIPTTDKKLETELLSTDFESLEYRDLANYLSKLLILALNKNSEAEEILLSKKLLDNCHAASAEHLNDCIKIYNWVVLSKKDGWYWNNNLYNLRNK